jgi:hypothetical protein
MLLRLDFVLALVVFSHKKNNASLCAAMNQNGKERMMHAG